MKLPLLLLFSCIIAAIAVPKKRSESRCEKIAPLVLAILQNDEYTQCLRNLLASEFFDIDLTDDAQVTSFVCDIVDQANSMPELISALDRIGVIDGVLQLSYSYMAFSSQYGLSFLRGEVAVGDRYKQCQAGRGYGYPGNSPISQEEIAVLLKAYDELAFFSFDYEKINRFASAISRQGHFFGMAPTVPKPCYCSAITDKQERCRIVTEAASPIWQRVVSNPAMRGMIEVGLRFAREYTGVNIVDNVETGVPRLLCELAGVQSIKDLRGFLEQNQVLEPLLELGYAGLGDMLNSLRRGATYTIQSYEDSENGDYNYSWRPSLEEYNAAKAIVALVDALREEGLDCLEPVYATKTIQRWCPWSEAPGFPNYYKAFF